MLLSHVKTSIKYKLSQSKRIDDDGLLASIVNEAMYYVCGRCVPNKLLCDGNDTGGSVVLRNLNGGLYIETPEYPDFSNEERHLQIDESLVFAVIHYSCFLVDGNANYKAIADEIINEHISHEGELNHA